MFKNYAKKSMYIVHEQFSCETSHYAVYEEKGGMGLS